MATRCLEVTRWSLAILLILCISVRSKGNQATSYDGPYSELVDEDKSVKETIIDKKGNVSEVEWIGLDSPKHSKKRSTSALYITMSHWFWDPWHTWIDKNELKLHENDPNCQPPQVIGPDRNCVTANTFNVEFDNRDRSLGAIGPFRRRDATTGQIQPGSDPNINGYPVGWQGFAYQMPNDDDPDPRRTRYKSTFDARLNIPIRALITLDQYARPTACMSTTNPDRGPTAAGCTTPQWDNRGATVTATGVTDNNKLPRPDGRDEFVVDLRTGVQPRTWRFQSTNPADRWDTGFLQGIPYMALPQNGFIDYSHRSKYTNNNDEYEKGHLIASDLFRTFFRRETRSGLADIVYDYATYMTNIFPQRDQGSHWQRMERDEMVAAKYCLDRRNVDGVPNKFHIVKGTIPSGPGASERYMQNTHFSLDGKNKKGFTNVNIPRYIYSAYCCSTYYTGIPGPIQSSKFAIFEHRVEGVNSPGAPGAVGGGVERDRIHWEMSGSDTMIDEFLNQLRTLWEQQHPAGTVYEEKKLFRVESHNTNINQNPCGNVITRNGNIDNVFNFANF